MNISGLKHKKMVHRYEQVQVYSSGEYRRRLDLVLSAMKQAEVDLLFVFAPSSVGYSFWLANDKDCDVMMVSAEGEVVLVYGNAIHKEEADFRPERRFSVVCDEPVAPYIRYADGINLNYARAGCRSGRVGVVNRHAMRADLKHALDGAVSGLQYVDMRSALGLAMSVKSAEEKRVLAWTADIEERMMAAVPMMLREGRYIRDMLLELRGFAHDMGAGNAGVQVFVTQAGPEEGGQYVPMQMGLCAYPPERIQKGYRLFVLIEINTFGQMFLPVGRNFVLGDPHPEALRLWEAAVKAQANAAAMLKPGVCLREIYDLNMEYIASLGVETNRQNYIHGMGSVPNEPPNVFDGTTEFAPLAKDMHILCHPHIRFQRGELTGREVYDDMYSIDSYFVSEEGGIRANNVPHEVFVI